MKKVAYLCFNDWAGYREQEVRIVGETPARYRISCDRRLRLAGHNRHLDVGKSVLVPKSAVMFKYTK